MVVEEYISEEPLRCGWRGCSVLVEPGLAYLVGEEVWHKHCYESPAGNYDGKQVNLEYDCKLPENPRMFFKQKDRDALLELDYIADLEEIAIEIGSENAIKLYDVVDDMIILNWKQKDSGRPNQYDPRNMGVMADFYAVREGFTPEVIEEIHNRIERGLDLKEDSRPYLRFFDEKNTSREIEKLEKLSKSWPDEMKIQMYKSLARIFEENIYPIKIDLLVNGHKGILEL